MPYSSVDEVPSYVPKAKRKQWREVWNSAYARAKKDGKDDKDAEASAFAQANGVAGPNATAKYQKLLDESRTDFANAFADSVIKEIERYWKDLPTEVRPALEQATLSGVGKGMLEIDVSNPKLLASANDVAQAYAAERAAELVGMKRDEEGNLIENPNAKWAISETTRERIREIIVNAFREDTALHEVKAAIQEALDEEANGSGIFSASRAKLIAQTEISNAQSGGNYSVWLQSGVVETLQWLTSEDEKVCPVCEGNDMVIVKIGQPFPSGDLYPGAHPLCRCGIVVHEVTAQ